MFVCLFIRLLFVNYSKMQLAQKVDIIASKYVHICSWILIVKSNLIYDNIVMHTSSYFLLMRASLNLYSVGSIVSSLVLHSLSKQYTLLPFTIVI